MYKLVRVEFDGYGNQNATSNGDPVGSSGDDAVVMYGVEVGSFRLSTLVLANYLQVVTLLRFVTAGTTPRRNLLRSRTLK